jgi:hypothetical protein
MGIAEGEPPAMPDGTLADTTHGICLECKARYFPGIDLDTGKMK